MLELGPLGFLRQSQQLVQLGLQLCDQLEVIADRLPKEIDEALRHSTIVQLRTLSTLHLRYESGLLFPLLRTSMAYHHDVIRTLKRLDDQHFDDEGYAAELADELSHFGECGSAERIDRLAYMLRGYFESVRRHIAIEADYILPLARRILTATDLKKLNSELRCAEIISKFSIA